MPTSLWLQVVQAVAARWRVVDGFRAPGDDRDGCTVYVAQAIADAEDPSGGDWAVVAWTGDPDDQTSPGEVVQTAGPMAAAAGRPRDEVGTITVRVCAQSGDVDPEATMATAVEYLAALESMLRDDPTVGVPARRMVVQLVSAVFAPFDNRGSVCVIDATLTYTARI